MDTTRIKFERPLREEELAILNERLDMLEIKLSRWLKFLGIWTLLALIIGAIAYSRMDTQGEINVLYITVAAYIGIGVWIVVEQRVKGNRGRKSIDYLKKKNLVTVVAVHSDIFYELEEKEDEGVHYLYQLENNKVFSFGGQNYYESETFPNNKFEIVEGRGIKDEILLLESFVYGEKISPKRVIKGKEKWDLLGSRNYPNPEELTVVDGRIEDYAPA